MCLAIPAKVTEMKDNRLATVDILGVTRDISLDLTPQRTSRLRAGARRVRHRGGGS